MTVLAIPLAITNVLSTLGQCYRIEPRFPHWEAPADDYRR
jgi:hypothetical protein